ncbi:hypothetical protein [Bifidobacterium oedipodis]|uniref:Uncharacterized protein n=1 Tax=Bifidobacterium oedipodis TaxID=2675322 RepID=A0A7Y0EP77_9BIFI|nr:hypothetical protein [Bifidobacterium sp. DSM 109957]NMM93914.1 hypothetical protein [Bifidobacterium sp. DSM 109957]
MINCFDIEKTTEGIRLTLSDLSEGVTFKAVINSYMAETIAEEITKRIKRGTELPLPTEPGFYRDKENDLWILTDSGEWYSIAQGGFDMQALPESEANKYYPFRRVEVDD